MAICGEMTVVCYIGKEFLIKKWFDKETHT